MVLVLAGWQSASFPMSREPADAWPDFVGWRVNYESAAYQIAEAIDAVPAPGQDPAVTPRPLSVPGGRQAAASSHDKRLDLLICDSSITATLC